MKKIRINNGCRINISTSDYTIGGHRLIHMKIFQDESIHPRVLTMLPKKAKEVAHVLLSIIDEITTSEVIEK